MVAKLKTLLMFRLVISFNFKEIIEGKYARRAFSYLFEYNFHRHYI